MADAGQVLMGGFGREFLGAAQIIFLVFVMGSHILTFTVMMNTLTEHGTCSIVFGVVGLVVSLLFTLPRTLKKVSWLSVSCECAMTVLLPAEQSTDRAISAFISILAAVLITMIAIGIQHPGNGRDATIDTSLYKAFIAVTNIVFAFGISLPSISFLLLC